jgi:hypothetical protein
MSHRILTTLAAFGVAASSCSGALSVSPGDAVTPPELGAPTISVSVLAADDLGALASTVLVDGVEVLDPAQDGAVVVWEGQPIDMTVSAIGFHSSEMRIEEYPDAGQIEFRLEPVVLTGRVTTDSGRPLPGAVVVRGAARDTTDNEGRYSLERATPGSINLSRPAWESVEVDWDGAVDQFDLSMSPLVINALRVSPEDVLDSERWHTILDLADTTGVNALAVDLKSEDGTVVYSTNVATANAIGAVSSYFDAADVVKQGHDRDLYMIARIGVFQDSFFAEAEPDHAVRNEDGTLWRTRNGFAWLDPSDPASYEYSIALGEEACRLGFDEVQFDYVSYPLGGDVSTAVFDGDYNQEVRVASIDAFLTRAYSVLHPVGCTVSTTLLGIVLESTSDEGVGQRPSAISRIVDVLSPTLYSTNYGRGWKGYEDPDEFATDIVMTALAGGVGKADGHAYFRPWLQTWAIDEAEQRAIQSGVSDLGMGWLLWSNESNYSRSALPPR